MGFASVCDLKFCRREIKKIVMLSLFVDKAKSASRLIPHDDANSSSPANQYYPSVRCQRRLESNIGYEKGENIVAHEGVAQTIAKVIAKLAAQHGPVVLSDQIRPELGRAVARIDRMWCGEDASMCTQLHQHHRRAPSWCRSGAGQSFPWLSNREESYANGSLADARHPFPWLSGNTGPKGDDQDHMRLWLYRSFLRRRAGVCDGS